VNAGNAAAASPTAGVVPAAADEVSALTAAQFGAHARMYQDFSAQAAAIHDQFCGHLGGQRRVISGHRGRQRSGRRLSGERFEYGFRGPTAGDQLCRDVSRSGVGSDAGRFGGLGGIDALRLAPAIRLHHVPSRQPLLSGLGIGSTPLGVPPRARVAVLVPRSADAEHVATQPEVVVFIQHIETGEAGSHDHDVHRVDVISVD
jgi:hypothetical protein